MEWIITYFSIGVVLTIVIAVLLGRSDDYILSEVIIICVGTLLTWPVFFPIHLNEYLIFRPTSVPNHLDCRMLRRLRRKARRQIKDLKKTGTLHLMYRTYDGKLHVVGSRSCEMDFSKNVESFRREWILQEVKNIRKKIHIGAHIGPMG